MTLFFISDLHLSAKRPKTSALFLKFLKTEAKKAQALYILGDFFEAWVGIVYNDVHDTQIMEALKVYTQTIGPVYFIRGNRDFLIDQSFTNKTGCKIIADPTVIEHQGKRVVLTHGDQLCTLDIAYQRFRRVVRHPFMQWVFLNLPLFVRQTIANLLRSNAVHRSYPTPILNPRFDVTPTAVNQILRDHHAHELIHGHTHHAKIHHFTLDGTPAQRMVLGDWGNTGSVLVYAADPQLQSVV